MSSRAFGMRRGIDVPRNKESLTGSSRESSCGMQSNGKARQSNGKRRGSQKVGLARRLTTRISSRTTNARRAESNISRAGGLSVAAAVVELNAYTSPGFRNGTPSRWRGRSAALCRVTFHFDRDSEDGIEVCRLAEPRTTIPVQYEGWSDSTKAEQRSSAPSTNRCRIRRQYKTKSVTGLRPDTLATRPVDPANARSDQASGLSCSACPQPDRRSAPRIRCTCSIHRATASRANTRCAHCLRCRCRPRSRRAADDRSCT